MQQNITSDQIKARIKELRRLRRKDEHIDAEQQFKEELLDHGLYILWVYSMNDYAVFCNEE